MWSFLSVDSLGSSRLLKVLEHFPRFTNVVPHRHLVVPGRAGPDPQRADVRHEYRVRKTNRFPQNGNHTREGHSHQDSVTPQQVLQTAFT
jgi:hypothetical protein